MYTSRCPSCSSEMLIEAVEGHRIEVVCDDCGDVLHLEKTNGSGVLTAKRRRRPPPPLEGDYAFEIQPLTPDTDSPS